MDDAHETTGALRKVTKGKSACFSKGTTSRDVKLTSSTFNTVRKASEQSCEIRTVQYKTSTRLEVWIRRSDSAGNGEAPQHSSRSAAQQKTHGYFA